MPAVVSGTEHTCDGWQLSCKGTPIRHVRPWTAPRQQAGRRRGNKLDGRSGGGGGLVYRCTVRSSEGTPRYDAALP